MAHHRLITHFETQGIAPDGFDHFDYVEAYEVMPEYESQAHPKKKRLAEEFAARCLAKMEEEPAAVKAERCRNFAERMKVYESIRQEKLEALRFISDKFDSKSGQLKYYPKINTRMASQKGRFWKDRDGLEAI